MQADGSRRRSWRSKESCLLIMETFAAASGCRGGREWELGHCGETNLLSCLCLMTHFVSQHLGLPLLYSTALAAESAAFFTAVNSLGNGVMRARWMRLVQTGHALWHRIENISHAFFYTQPLITPIVGASDTRTQVFRVVSNACLCADSSRCAHRLTHRIIRIPAKMRAQYMKQWLAHT